MDLFETRPLHWLRDYLNSHPRVENFARTVLEPVEAVTKKPTFGCQSCGQCLLHENGLTCPMRCPKNLRNGPCGGVRMNGHCEVYPERWCVWYKAYYRSQRIPVWQDHIYHRHPPVNWLLVNSCSWVNLFTGRDVGIPPKSAEPKPKPKAAAPAAPKTAAPADQAPTKTA